MKPGLAAKKPGLQNRGRLGILFRRPRATSASVWRSLYDIYLSIHLDSCGAELVLEFACVSFRVDILSSLIQRESKPQAPIQPCSTTHSPSIAIDKVQGTLWAITSLAFRTYKFTPRNFSPSAILVYQAPAIKCRMTDYCNPLSIPHSFEPTTRYRKQCYPPLTILHAKE